MMIELTGGGCTAKAPGPCTGDTAAECPSGYTGTDTFSGKPPTCPGEGVGVSHHLASSKRLGLMYRQTSRSVRS